MFEAVIWDVGGVILPHREALGRERWRLRLGLSVDEFQGKVWQAMGSSGAAETDAIVARIASALFVSKTDAELILREFHEHWQPDQPLLRFAASLRERVEVGVLANAGAAARWGFEAILGLNDIADVIVISAEVGIEKPDPRIYRVLIDRLGEPAASCVFIDDRPDNVDAARDVGMAGVVHTSPQKTIEVVEQLLRAN